MVTSWNRKQRFAWIARSWLRRLVSGGVSLSRQQIRPPTEWQTPIQWFSTNNRAATTLAWPIFCAGETVSVARTVRIWIEHLPSEIPRCDSRIANILVKLSDAGIDLEGVEKEMSRQAFENERLNQARADSFLNICRIRSYIEWRSAPR